MGETREGTEIQGERERIVGDRKREIENRRGWEKRQVMYREVVGGE